LHDRRERRQGEGGSVLSHDRQEGAAGAGDRAARLWIDAIIDSIIDSIIDAIIDPAKTRAVLMLALEACALKPDVPKFNAGVIQT